jgi:hypothetical protein
MCGTSRVGCHLAVLLADLVAKLVQIDQLQYLSHGSLLVSR